MAKILISNDDGIDSQGIQCLAKVLSDIADVIVVAPTRERSTAGHSLTLHKPLRVFDRGNNQYAASGTPADCIYLGVNEILKARPDYIVSGINRGANLGTDVFYSGTVAAAREGALMGIPSFAFSLVEKATLPDKVSEGPFLFEDAAKVARTVFEKLCDVEFPRNSVINVNIPNIPYQDVKGYAIARQGVRFYSNQVTRREDPRGRPYFWIGGAYAGFDRGEYSDCQALEEGKVAVTPLAIECTHNGFYTTLQKHLASF